MKYNNYKSYIFILILLSLASRIFAFYFVSDLNLVNEWRVLIHNLDISGTLGYNVVIDEFYALPKLATKTDLVLPSVFMPPFYAFFLYVIQLIFSIIKLYKYYHWDSDLFKCFFCIYFF